MLDSTKEACLAVFKNIDFMQTGHPKLLIFQFQVAILIGGIEEGCIYPCVSFLWITLAAQV